MQQQFLDLENRDGVRFTWNVLPMNYSTSEPIPVPIASSYTPLKPLSNLGTVNYKPVLCTKCSCILNPYCRVNYPSKSWACPLCLTANRFPTNYSEISVQNRPPELLPQYTTIEYMLNITPAQPPIFLFVVDIAIIADELKALKTSILQTIMQLPPDSLIGLITFGANVHVHDLAHEDCNKSYVYRGTREATSEQLTSMLGLKLVTAPATVTQNGQLLHQQPSFENPAGIAHRYLVPVSTGEMQLVSVFDSLIRDPWSYNEVTHRAKRCTGAALSLAATLLETACKGQNARIILATGGVCTVGPGQTAALELSESLRSHHDLQRKTAPYYDAASTFYSNLAARVSNNSHVIDIFACCLDQVGLAEMRACVEITGGQVVLDDSFTRGVFQGSIKRMFATDRADNNNLVMGFNAEIQVQCSSQLKVAGAIGKVTPMPRETHFVDNPKNSHGISGTCAWRLGGLDHTSSVTVFFNAQPCDPTVDAASNNQCFIQYTTKYRHASGRTHIRCSTIAKSYASMSNPQSLQSIKAGFDQEAAAVAITRLALFKTKTEYPMDILRWLDKTIIRLCARFGVRQDNNLQLSPEFKHLPQFIFHLRRSQLLQIFNCSPDEVAFFRLVALHEHVGNTLLMIQPYVIAYSLESQPTPVPLDITALATNRILFMDTFFHLVIWYGEQIHSWKSKKIQDLPEYAHFATMLKAPLIEAKSRIDNRFPAPKLIECVQDGSQARFLLAKVDPSLGITSNTNTNNQGKDDNSTIEPAIFSEDLNMKTFMEHLKKLVLQEKEMVAKK